MDLDKTWDSYTVQTWDGERRVSADLISLSLAAAREVARAHRMCGYTARLMSEQHDYCEVYASDGVRRGTFAQTTRVHV